MKDENANQDGANQEEKRKKLIEIAKEKLTELDDEELEKLAGGTAAEEGTGQGVCTCQKMSCF